MQWAWMEETTILRSALYSELCDWSHKGVTVIYLHRQQMIINNLIHADHSSHWHSSHWHRIICITTQFFESCIFTWRFFQIYSWTQGFFGWSWDFRKTLENTLVQSWFFWLGTQFWVCITFCRVRHNVRLIIIIIINQFSCSWDE